MASPSPFRLTFYRVVFLPGKYSDELGRADEWYARGKMVSVTVLVLTSWDCGSKLMVRFNVLDLACYNPYRIVACVPNRGNYHIM